MITAYFSHSPFSSTASTQAPLANNSSTTTFKPFRAATWRGLKGDSSQCQRDTYLCKNVSFWGAALLKGRTYLRIYKEYMNIFTFLNKNMCRPHLSQVLTIQHPTVLPCWPRFLCRYDKYSEAQTTSMTVDRKPEKECKLQYAF